MSLETARIGAEVAAHVLHLPEQQDGVMLQGASGGRRVDATCSTFEQ
jgi:hypothetical protein